MINISLALLTLHFFADFVLQTDLMAINKSKSYTALGSHVGVYSLVFLPFYGLSFALATFGLHFFQDAVTSRISAKLWRANQRHWFFVCIGADQLLHYFTLAWTAKLFGV